MPAHGHAPAASPAPVLLDHYALAQAFPQVQREYAWTTVLAPPLVGFATFPEFRGRELEQTSAP